MFGNFTEQSASIPVKDRNGFLALAEFDKPDKGGNGDGVIDTQDTVFSNLRLWQDADHNGISEPNELKTLSEHDVVSMDLKNHESKRTNEHGNRFESRSILKDIFSYNSFSNIPKLHRETTNRVEALGPSKAAHLSITESIVKTASKS